MSDYTLPQELLLLIPFLNVIGAFLKKTPSFPNWLIPVMLGIIGIIFGLLIEFTQKGFNLTAILYGFINGIIAAGIAVYGHQIVKQNTEKNDP